MASLGQRSCASKHCEHVSYGFVLVPLSGKNKLGPHSLKQTPAGWACSWRQVQTVVCANFLLAMIPWGKPRRCQQSCILSRPPIITDSNFSWSTTPWYVKFMPNLRNFATTVSQEHLKNNPAQMRRWSMKKTKKIVTLLWEGQSEKSPLSNVNCSLYGFQSEEFGKSPLVRWSI